MASKDGKIFDTIVYIGLGVNALTALYLLLMYFELIKFREIYQVICGVSRAKPLFKEFHAFMSIFIESTNYRQYDNQDFSGYM